jgi:multidrug efflux pump subunit AcrA (membrane-fusion protein)
MKIKGLIVPAIALVLLLFSARHMALAAREHARPEPPAAPPTATQDGSAVAGLGIVEPAGEVVRLGAHRSGVVAQILVTAGDKVKAGATLLCLDTRAAEAEVKVRESDLAFAQAELSRLRRLPRPTSLAPLQSRVAAAEARLRQIKDHAKRTQSLVDRAAAPEEEAVQSGASALEAEHQRDSAREELDLAAEGAWGPDLAVATTRVQHAEAALGQARTELDLQCLKSPLDAIVLKVGVRRGEFVSAASDGAGLSLGSDLPLQVRVDFDEADIGRFASAKRASGVFRDAREHPCPLKLLRVEPQVTPKRVFSGATLERVDTRVLQVIYAFDGALPASTYVGQQVDVFVE